MHPAINAGRSQFTTTTKGSHKNMTCPPFDIAGKTALMTGGNSGIGLGMAEALASAGANICVRGTNKQKNALAHRKLTRHGVKVLALECDVSVETAVEKAFARTVDTFGQVDACFANAGVGDKATFFVEMNIKTRNVGR